MRHDAEVLPRGEMPRRPAVDAVGNTTGRGSYARLTPPAPYFPIS
jgi:hypothetical protein